MTEQVKGTMSVREMAAYLGIGKALAWDIVWQGKVPVIRFGRRVLIPKAALDRMLLDAKPTGAR